MAVLDKPRVLWYTFLIFETRLYGKIMTTHEPAWALDMGRMGYQEAFELQKQCVAARGRDEIPDTFIMLEHNPVFTANREVTLGNIIASPEVLAEHGIEVCKTDRGGDVTYHGPGQITGYSIMDLKKQGRDLHCYIRNIEQVLIDTVADYGIASGRDPINPGVWVGMEKVAAIGIAVKSGWISMHGFGFNIHPDMKHYQMIIACGIRDRGVTSLQKLAGRDIEMSGVKERLSVHYGKIFNREMRHIRLEELPW